LWISKNKNLSEHHVCVFGFCNGVQVQPMQVTPAKVNVTITPSPAAQRYPNCDWRQQRFDVSVNNDGPSCTAATGIVNLYLIAGGDNWNAANFSLPPTDPLPSINPYSINTRFPAIGQIGQAVTRAGNIFINTVTQVSGPIYFLAILDGKGCSA
jgi:hypothetical protein